MHATEQNILNSLGIHLNSANQQTAAHLQENPLEGDTQDQRITHPILHPKNRKHYLTNQAGQIVGINLDSCDEYDLGIIPNFTQLRYLNINNHSTATLAPLEHCQNLREIILGATNTAHLSFLENLPLLNSIDLDCVINNNDELNEIAKLRQIRSLRLSVKGQSNPTVDLSPIAGLKNLQNLELTGVERIIDFSPLEELPKLTTLELDGRPVVSQDPITRLRSLRNLKIRRGRLSFGLDQLASKDTIKSLEITATSFEQFRQLHQLKNLQSLAIKNTKLSSGAAIPKLPYLNSLDLSFNYISSTKTLEHLANLRTLIISGNPNIELNGISSFFNLTALRARMVNLADCNLISKLRELEYLDLSNNFLSNISPLFELIRLKHLELAYNEIENIEGLSNFRNLERLDLRNNKITSFPPIFESKRIQGIDIRKNAIRSLQEDCLDLGLDLERGDKHPGFLYSAILWDDNPIVAPDQTLLCRGNKAVRDYFTALREENATTPMREAKLLVVGEAEVGKTSLIKQLTNKGFSKNERKTHDIGRYPHSIECATKGPIDLKIWDFGGQEIMHATHQFFLTKRSVYILVLNSRQTESQCRVEYWLRLIASFGGDSPVIVVCNKCDEGVMDLAWRNLKDKFPQIRHFVKRSSCYIDQENEDDRREGIDEVRKYISSVLEDDLPEVGRPIPSSWFAVKRDLEERARSGQDYLSLSTFGDLCQKNQVKRGSETTLLDFLHDLGVVLHFGEGHPLIPQGHPLLDEVSVLNPAWVTAAIYKILNDRPLAVDHKGVLSRQYLIELLECISAHDYFQKEDFILEMMRRFELCFEIPDVESHFLIPDLLPKEGPDTGDWTGSLRFRYDYTVLPQSVISRFIVRMHTLISEKTYWRFGVLLRREGIRALVKADLEDAVIDVFLTEGEDGTKEGRRRFLEAIRIEFEKIHFSFSEKLGEREVVPDPTDNSVFENYRKLLEMEASGEIDTWIEGHGRRPISAFLDGVATPKDRHVSLRDFRQDQTLLDAEVSELFVNERKQRAQALPWVIWSLLYGLGAAAIVTLFFFVPFLWMKLALSIFGGVTSLMLFRNPTLHWRRMFGIVVAAAIGANLVGIGIEFWHRSVESDTKFEWSSEVGWPTVFLFAVFAVCCLIGDYFQSRNRNA